MKPSPRPRLLAFIALSWMLGLLAPPLPAANRFAAPGQERPNFLFLFSDDQAYRTLGLLGEWPCRTPNLDRLARRGVQFTHCFNQGGWSGAVCIPSRAMLNTGRTIWQSRASATNEAFPAGAALWGETLGRAGYNTYMAGKWHNPLPAQRRSFQTLGPQTGGFLPSTTNGGAAYFRPASGNAWTPDGVEWKGHWLQTNGVTRHSSEWIAEAAIDFLRTNAAIHPEPFFMYVAFNAPHDPRQAPREFLDLYPAAKLKLPPNFLPRHPFRIETYEGRDEILAPYPRTPEIIRTHLQEYFAIITHLDAQIGRILDALEASGKAGNTIIIFTADQGLAVGQHGLMGKQSLYDHSLRVPFLLAGPGLPKGQRQDALFHMQSLFATTCDMAGVPVPPTVQFPSLVPLLTGAQSTLHEALYGAFLNRQRSVRTERWKLIRTPLENEVQLFDIRKDPWEMNNLAGDPRHAATLAELDRQLIRLMGEMKDPMSPEFLLGRPVPTTP